jgi:hypothetical protein
MAPVEDQKEGPDEKSEFIQQKPNGATNGTASNGGAATNGAATHSAAGSLGAPSLGVPSLGFANGASGGSSGATLTASQQPRVSVQGVMIECEVHKTAADPPPPPPQDDDGLTVEEMDNVEEAKEGDDVNEGEAEGDKGVGKGKDKGADKAKKEKTNSKKEKAKNGVVNEAFVQQ